MKGDTVELKLYKMGGRYWADLSGDDSHGSFRSSLDFATETARTSFLKDIGAVITVPESELVAIDEERPLRVIDRIMRDNRAIGL